ncbi:MAG: ABC transporter permease, partial [Spirochaetia bacterium]|nr:ABC transporter permease [Spirochaetia bacterium]
GMLTAPITVEDIFLGEILWASSKGFFFALAALGVAMAAGIIREPLALLTPIVGFLTGFLFAALSLWVTTLVKTIQHFNFYFSGILSPMFFFSGVVFPLNQLPHFLRPLAEILPLTHAVRLSRDLCSGKISWMLAIDTAAMICFGLLFTYWAIHRLKKKLIH